MVWKSDFVQMFMYSRNKLKYSQPTACFFQTHTQVDYKKLQRWWSHLSHSNTQTSQWRQNWFSLSGVPELNSVWLTGPFKQPELLGGAEPVYCWHLIGFKPTTAPHHALRLKLKEGVFQMTPKLCSAAFKLPLMFSDALTLRNILFTAGMKPAEDLRLVHKQFGDRCFFTIKHWCKHWSRTLFDLPLQFKNSSQRQEKKYSSETTATPCAGVTLLFGKGKIGVFTQVQNKSGMSYQTVINNWFIYLYDFKVSKRHYCQLHIWFFYPVTNKHQNNHSLKLLIDYS